MVSTQRAFDSKGVKAFIEASGLDPVPQADPKQMILRGVRLSVEQYTWGRIYYAEDRNHDVGMTWTEFSGEKQEVPGWVSDLRARVDRPPCLGMHEDDHLCDGGENPVTGEQELACRWRKVCLQVQTLGRTEAGIAKMLGQYDDDELWAKVEARPKEKHKAKKEEPTVDAESVQELVTNFSKMAAERCKAFFAESRHRASVSDWFLVEYPSGLGRTWALFRRRLRGTDPTKDATTEQSLAIFSLHSREMSSRIDIRTSNIDLAIAMLATHSPRLARDHERRMVRLTLNAENASVIADFLAHVVQTDDLTSYGRGAKEKSSRISTRRFGST